MKYPIDIILHVLNTKGARSIKDACKCLNWPYGTFLAYLRRKGKCIVPYKWKEEDKG